MSINSKKPYCFRKTRFNYDPLLARFHPFYAARTRDMSKRKNTPPETAECPRLGIERREIERGYFYGVKVERLGYPRPFHMYKIPGKYVGSLT
jgi:hypothetical protein